jgi:hypothetical protein
MRSVSRDLLFGALAETMTVVGFDARARSTQAAAIDLLNVSHQ